MKNMNLKTDHLLIILLSVALSACSVFKTSMNEAYRVGQESAMTKYLDDDEKKYFQENRDFITQGELKSWANNKDRYLRDKFRVESELEEKVAKRRTEK